MKNVLYTKYEKNLDTSSPYADYPRPQMKRESFLSLNGLWDFAFSRREDIPTHFSKKILVPFPPESRLSQICLSHAENEFLYYRKTFVLPEDFVGKNIILHFGGVDQICYVFINGKRIGENEGGYIPFSFSITNYLKSGTNVISLKVVDNLDKTYPYGKQTKSRGGMWYTQVSGIWQSVWLEAVPQNHIEKIKITPDLRGVEIEVFTAAEEKRITISETGESFSFTDNKIRIEPSEIRLWSPDSPYLYHFTLETENDRVTSYFALREIKMRSINGVMRLCLNGEPYLFNGLLDQGYYPDGIFLPATSEGYRDDILLAKQMGFNMLRKHIKIEPQIFYTMCDELGMIVFQDMVNNSDYSFFRDTALPTVAFKRRKDKNMHKNPRSRAIFEKSAAKTVELLYNHPSVLYYTVFNEGWGQFSADDMYYKLKMQDETRIFDSTSGWFWQSESDVVSHHVYFKKLRARPHPERPVVISEFGGYSLRIDGHLFGEGNYGYTSCKSTLEFAKAVERLYIKEALPLVKKCLSALVYTQISDVEDETNGLITYDREVVKIEPELMKKINGDLQSAFAEATKKQEKIDKK